MSLAIGSRIGAACLHRIPSDGMERPRMTQEAVFRYQPACSSPGCDLPAVYKVAANWSDGTSQELKNYGLACEEHRQSALDAARKRRAALKLWDGETVGTISLYKIQPGRRDVELVPEGA